VDIEVSQRKIHSRESRQDFPINRTHKRDDADKKFKSPTQLSAGAWNVCFPVKIPLRSAFERFERPVQAWITGSSPHRVLVNASNRVERRDVKLGIQTAAEAEVCPAK